MREQVISSAKVEKGGPIPEEGGNKQPSHPTFLFSIYFGGQDIEINAEDEDLPPGWVKMQRKNRSVYYFHTMTAATTSSPPRERGESSPRTAATAAPRRPNGIRSRFRVREWLYSAPA